jgi:uncharacterized protein YggE
MKVYVCLLACLLAIAAEAQAQTGGNIVYSDANRRLGKVPITLGAIPIPDNSGMLIPAHVQINIKADEHVALFGLSQEGRTIQECMQKLDPQLENFIGELKKIGLKAEDVAIDHTTQTRTYDYQISGSVANEKATGFIVKKTVFVHFKEKEWMDKLMAAAAKSNIYDLIKVDYLVNNPTAIREKLLAESARIIKEKADRYDKLLGLKFRSQVQVMQESYNTVFPTEAYDSYAAFESGKVSESTFSDRNRVKEARKEETFFFNTKDAGDFDNIINPVVTEPVIQFSLYLQIKYLFDK